MNSFRWLVCLILSAIVLCSMPVSAQFYRYTDKNGSVRFTDDITQVPEDQRESVMKYNNSEAADSQTDATGQDAVSNQTDQNPPENDLAAWHERLLARNQELDMALDQLKEELMQLEAERANLANENIEAFNQKVEALNEKIKNYDIQRQAYMEDAEKYNNAVQEQNNQESGT